MKIKCAAIRRKSGQVFEGKNHAVCFLLMKEAGVPRLAARRSMCGFVTDTGKFVNRHRAAEIAHKAGQIKKLKIYLYSEDLKG